MVNLDKPSLPARRNMTVSDFPPAIARVDVAKRSANATVNRHLDAIKSGLVCKSNIIGIRKILNAAWRVGRGYSLSRTCPQVTGRDSRLILDALAKHSPSVYGELHDSGLKLLRSPRYRKRLASVADIIASDMRFDLIRFDDVARGQFVPVYAARGWGKSFAFRNIPWQTASALGLESGPSLEAE